METILFGASVVAATAYMRQEQRQKHNGVLPSIKAAEAAVPNDADRSTYAATPETSVSSSVLSTATTMTVETSSMERQQEQLIPMIQEGRILAVSAENEPLQDIVVFQDDMSLSNTTTNIWHQATYVVIQHMPHHVGQYEDVYVLVQRHPSVKPHTPGALDPTPGGMVRYGETYYETAAREIFEKFGFHPDGDENTIKRLFTFPYQDEQVKVWGEFYECVYRGALKDLDLLESDVHEVLRMSLQELFEKMEDRPELFLPDARHAMKLYAQWLGDLKVKRRFLKGSSGDLQRYNIRPQPKAIFFDCDDTLYFDGWVTANRLTAKIDEWCVGHGLKPGQAYQLYKQYGTALKGLLAEGYMEETEDEIDSFLEQVHDIGVKELLVRDDKLREMILNMAPDIPKYIFTSSVAHHASRCLQALGIDDLFVEPIIDCKMCNFESKHTLHSFQVAMKIAGIRNPEECLFLDDNLTNIQAARQVGWRSVLVGRTGRDSGLPVSSEHAELEIDSIHEVPQVLPELFVTTTAAANSTTTAARN